MDSDLLTLLKDAFLKEGIDSNCYSQQFLKRRAKARMNYTGSPDLTCYIERLSIDGRERKELAKKILIPTTSFFRNPDVFNEIKEIFSSWKRHEKIRCLSAPCSSGEEIYSLAILLEERKTRGLGSYSALAIDKDTQSIQKAKKANYSEKKVEGIDKRLIMRYLIKEGNSFKPCDEIIRKVEIISMNLLRDLPKESFDLILCRNFLIYLTPDAQENFLKRLYDILTDNGILMLGKIEKISASLRNLYKPLRKEMSIYQKC